MEFINLYFVNSVATIVQGFSVSDISMCSDQTVEPDFKFGHLRSRVGDVFGIGTIMMKDLRDTGIWKSVVRPIYKDGAPSTFCMFLKCLKNWLNIRLSLIYTAVLLL